MKSVRKLTLLVYVIMVLICLGIPFTILNFWLKIAIILMTPVLTHVFINMQFRRFRISAEVKDISELPAKTWFGVADYDEHWNLICLRRLSEVGDLTLLEPSEVVSDDVWYRYNKSTLTGKPIRNGLFLKSQNDCGTHFEVMPYPSTNIGGVLLIWG